MTGFSTDEPSARQGPLGLRQRIAAPGPWANLAGVVLVGAGVLAVHTERPVAVLSLAAVALAAWAAWTLLGPGRVRDVAFLVGGLAAAVGTGLDATVLIAVLIAAVMLTVGDHRRPVPAVSVYVAALVLALALAAAAAGTPVGDTAATGGGLAIAVLAAVTRRQSRTGAERERELQQRALETEREAERSRLLAERSAVARDIHDVLAHSLGGLVLQLDAIDALLEHGRTAEAAARVTQAHRLATEGLTEARRAVTALRDPAANAPSVDPAALADLVEAHRALGAHAEVTGDLDLDGLDAPHRAALLRALQEALSNARRHAPGATSRIRAVRDGVAMTLTVATPMPPPAGGPPAPSEGGGNGLRGMRERFAALGDASAVTAGPRGDRFVVDARVELR